MMCSVPLSLLLVASLLPLLLEASTRSEEEVPGWRNQRLIEFDDSESSRRLVRLLSVEQCEAGDGGKNESRSDSQGWVRLPSGDQQGDYRLQLEGSSLCVSLNNSADERTLFLSGCTSGEKDALQLWKDSDDPRAGPGFVCAAAASTVCDGDRPSLPCCLTIAGGSTSVGAAVNLYRRCTNGPPCINQQWHFGNDTNRQHIVAADGYCLSAGPPSTPTPLPPPPSPPVPPSNPAYTPAPPYRDSALDCAVRTLAFTMSTYGLAGSTALQPGDIGALREALALQRCNTSTLGWEPSPVRHRTHDDVQSLTVAVDGDDNLGDGSVSRPLRSVGEALQRSRSFDGKAEILLRPGAYEHDNQLMITAANSGLSIRPHPGNPSGSRVTLSAGKKLRLRFRQSHTVGDTVVLVADVPTMAQPITQLFGSDGERLMRARWPNVDDGEAKVSRMLQARVTNPSSLGTVVQPIDGEFPQWFPLTSPRYTVPFFAYYQGGTLAERFAHHRSVAAFSYNEPGCNCGMSYDATTVSKNLNRWHAQSSEPILHLQDDSHGTSFVTFAVNSSGSTFDFVSGGWHVSPNIGGESWFVDNALVELDMDGEWYHDATKNQLWLGVNASEIPAPGAITELWASQLETLINISGTVLQPVRNVSIEGVTITHTQVDWGVGTEGTDLFHRWEELSNGDHAVSRRGAVLLENVENATVADCRFDQVGGTAIVVSRHAYDVSIRHNVIVRPGDTGVQLIGSFANGTSKGVLHPHGINVSANLITDVGQYARQGSCFWQAIAGSIANEPSTHVSDNTFYKSARHAIELNDGFGGGTVFRRNVVFSCMQQTVDGGPIHSWNRMPYLQEQQDGTWSIEPKQTIVENSLIINNGADWDPAKCQSRFCHEVDDGSSHWTYRHNLLAYGAFGNWLGGNNKVTGNFILRADLSGTDDVTIDSPVCHWSMFENPVYWQQHGSNNSFDNNVCLHWFGDLYAYGQYWTPSQSNRIIGRRVQAKGRVPPPYVHSKCDPSLITKAAWPSVNNTIMSVVEPRVRCGDRSWNISEWKALGFDAGSTVQLLPNATWAEDTVGMIMERALAVLDLG